MYKYLISNEIVNYLLNHLPNTAELFVCKSDQVRTKQIILYHSYLRTIL